MRSFCSICTNYGPELRPRQLTDAGPIFIICRRCDETDAETIRQRPAQYAIRRRTTVRWQRHCYQPIDESERDLGFRILRAVQRFDWVSSIELIEVLAIPSVTIHRQLHNNYSVQLSRLNRKKFLRRRHILEWMEYQITALGLARIESWERAAVETKASITA